MPTATMFSKSRTYSFQRRPVSVWKEGVSGLTCYSIQVPYKDNFYGKVHGRGQNLTLAEFYAKHASGDSAAPPVIMLADPPLVCAALDRVDTDVLLT
jgi:hypothetical protein